MADCQKCPLFPLIHSLLPPDGDQWIERNISLIKRIISLQSGVSIKELESKSRKQHIVQARKIAMARCRQMDIPFSRIGRAFNRSPSTVMYALT